MKSISNRFWKENVASKPSEKLLGISRSLNIPIPILQILESRGVSGEKKIKEYLFPRLADLPDPFLFDGMKDACEAIYHHLLKKDTIVIWGDYDVDGVTSTSLLIRFFRDIGEKVQWFVPNRYTDGYGLNTKKIDALIESTVHPLFITVDCGISAFEEVDHIRAKGCDVIITDHHTPAASIPSARAIINPKLKHCPFPDENLAGVGVSFYLAAALRMYLTEKGYFTDGRKQPNMKQYLDLVAIGTIADMVYLSQNNRILVRAGFEVIDSSPSCGIQALLEESDITTEGITSEDISFSIGPKINSAGRLQDASLAVELLTAEDEKIAKKLASKLTRINNERKNLCGKYLEFTLDYIKERREATDSILVLQTKCPSGILGIVASQLLSIYNIPVILVTETEDAKYGTVLKGSCRSTENVNIFETLTACQRYLLDFGGHHSAAGVTIHPDSFQDFKHIIKDIIKKLNNIDKKYRSADLAISIEDAMRMDFLASYVYLEPFGQGNEPPVFLNKNAILQDIRQIGKERKHLSFNTRGMFAKTKCVAFGFGEHIQDLYAHESYDLAFSLSLNRFKQKTSYQANIIDIFAAREGEP